MMTQHSSASKMMLTRITSKTDDAVTSGFTTLVEEFLVVLDEEEVVEGRVLVVGMLVEFGVREELDGGELVAREELGGGELVAREELGGGELVAREV